MAEFDPEGFVGSNPFLESDPSIANEHAAQNDELNAKRKEAIDTVVETQGLVSPNFNYANTMPQTQNLASKSPEHEKIFKEDAESGAMDGVFKWFEDFADSTSKAFEFGDKAVIERNALAYEKYILLQGDRDEAIRDIDEMNLAPPKTHSTASTVWHKMVEMSPFLVHAFTDIPRTMISVSGYYSDQISALKTLRYEGKEIPEYQNIGAISEGGEERFKKNLEDYRKKEMTGFDMFLEEMMVTAKAFAFTSAARIPGLGVSAEVNMGSVADELSQIRDQNGKPLDPETIRTVAIIYGGTMAGLDYIGLKALGFGKLKLSPSALKKLVQMEGVKKVLGRGGISTVVNYAKKNGVGAAKDFGTEVVTEGMQDYLGGEALNVASRYEETVSKGERTFEYLSRTKILERGFEGSSEAAPGTAGMIIARQVIGGAGRASYLAASRRRKERANAGKSVELITDLREKMDDVKSAKDGGKGILESELSEQLGKDVQYISPANAKDIMAKGPVLDMMGIDDAMVEDYYRDGKAIPIDMVKLAMYVDQIDSKMTGLEYALVLNPGDLSSYDQMKNSKIDNLEDQARSEVAKAAVYDAVYDSAMGNESLQKTLKEEKRDPTTEDIASNADPQHLEAFRELSENEVENANVESLMSSVGREELIFDEEVGGEGSQKAPEATEQELDAVLKLEEAEEKRRVRATKKADAAAERKEAESQLKRIVSEIEAMGFKGRTSKDAAKMISVFAKRNSLYHEAIKPSMVLSRMKFKQAEVDDKTKRMRTFLPSSPEKLALRPIEAFSKANTAAFVHELGHVFLMEMEFLVNSGIADKAMLQDWETVMDFTANRTEDYQKSVGGDFSKEEMEGSDLTRSQHEIVAEMFTLFLKEGKAPTPKLKAVFSRFMTWVKEVFSSLKELTTKTDKEGKVTESLQGVALNDEIRSVFSRWFAIDNEIEEYARVQEVFITNAQAERIGLPDSIKDTLKGVSDKMKSDVKAEYYSAVAKGINSNKEKWIKEAKAASALHPIYQMFERVLKDKEFRMDIDLAKDFLSKEDFKALRQKNSRMFKTGGLPLLMFAEEFGYTDAKAMFSDTLATKPKKEFESDIKKANEIEYFRGFDPEEFFFDHANDMAKYQEAMYKYDIANLGLKTKVRAEDLKQDAALIFEETSVKEALNPGSIGAAVKRGLKAQVEARLRGDLVEAHELNKQTLTSAEELKLMKGFRKEFDKLKNLQKKIINKGVKGVDQSFYNQAMDILYRYGLADSKKDFVQPTETFGEFIKARFESMGSMDFNPTENYGVDLLNRNEVSSYKDILVNDLRQVTNAIEFLYKGGISEMENKMLPTAQKREYIITSWLSSVEGRKGRGFMGDDTSTAGAMAEGTLRKGFSSMQRPKFAIEELDGNVSIKGREGVLEQFVYNPLEFSQGKTDKLRKEIQKRITGTMQHFTDRYDESGKHLVIPERLTPQIMTARNKKWTFEKVIIAALNMGNVYNRKAMFDGYGINEAQMQEIFSMSLTEADWDNIQNVWDAMKELYPYVNAEFKKLHYHDLPRVEADSWGVQISNGDFKVIDGGYFPIQFDGGLENFSDADARSEAFTSTMIKGMDARNTIGRKGTGGRPLRLSFNVIGEHFERNTHYAGFASSVEDAYRVLTDKRVADRAKGLIGEEYYRNLIDNINRIARPEKSSGNAILEFGRRASAIASLGLRPSVAFKQFLSAFNYGQEYGFDTVWDGITSYNGGKAYYDEMISKYSPMMDNRANNMDRDWYEDFSRVNVNKKKPLDRMTEKFSEAASKIGLPKFNRKDMEQVSFYMIRSADHITVRNLWAGAFNKAKMKGKTDRFASMEADKTIVSTQPSGRTIDLSSIERDKGGWMRLFTSFMSFRFVYGNRMRQYITAKKQGDISWGEYARHFFYEGLMPTIAISSASLGIMALSGDEEDESNILSEMAIDAIGAQAGVLPLVGDAYNAGVYAFKNGRIADAGAFDSPAMRVFGEGIQATVAVSRMLADLDDDNKRDIALWKLFEAASFYYKGIPIAPLVKQTRDLIEFMEN